MGHDLQAFIARDDVADAIRASQRFPFIARLPFGLSLVPIDARWVYAEDDRTQASGGVPGLPDYAMYGVGHLHMEPVVAKIGVDHSTIEPVLFASTEWFGGVGGSQGWWFEQGSRISLVGVSEGLLALGVRPASGEGCGSSRVEGL